MNQAEQLAQYINTLADFAFQEEVTSGYDHMGAIIVDAGLQAGIRYETAVLPRINKILATYPDAKTTSEFQRILMIEGATNLLNWSLDRKVNTIVDVTLFFIAEQIETDEELRSWLLHPENIDRLKQIKGIGNKTADYFKILVGIPTSAIDRHLYSFMADAGIYVNQYDAAQQIIRDTAVLLTIDERTLDYSIWKYKAGI